MNLSQIVTLQWRMVMEKPWIDLSTLHHWTCFEKKSHWRKFFCSLAPQQSLPYWFGQRMHKISVPNICMYIIYFKNPKWPKSFLAVQISNLQTVKNHGSEPPGFDRITSYHNDSNPILPPKNLTITGDSRKRSIGCLESWHPTKEPSSWVFVQMVTTTGSVSSEILSKTPKKNDDVPTQWFQSIENSSSKGLRLSIWTHHPKSTLTWDTQKKLVERKTLAI